MELILTLIIGLLIGFPLGAYFTLKNKTEILKGAFKDMTDQEVLEWHNKNNK